MLPVRPVKVPDNLLQHIAVAVGDITLRLWRNHLQDVQILHQLANNDLFVSCLPMQKDLFIFVLYISPGTPPNREGPSEGCFFQLEAFSCNAGILQGQQVDEQHLALNFRLMKHAIILCLSWVLNRIWFTSSEPY